jgi:hypothetical protein
MRIVVAVATTGRASVVSQMLARLERLSPPPHGVVVVGAGPDDVAGLTSTLPLTVVLSEKGLCRQRNQALRTIGDDADVVAFLDDDYVPAPGFIAGVERLFAAHPDVVVATGRVIADGINSAGIGFEMADSLIAADAADPNGALVIEPRFGAYGCNMVIRVSAVQDARFDENLPLYGWQEDIDFSGQLSRRGRVVWSNAFSGVHLGVKMGRTSGVRLGYSQVVNPLYLARKGTFPWTPALGLIGKNLVANLVKSLAPEPYVDRRGRLQGNLLAVRDVAFGKVDPTKVLRLNR